MKVAPAPVICAETWSPAGAAAVEAFPLGVPLSEGPHPATSRTVATARAVLRNRWFMALSTTGGRGARRMRHEMMFLLHADDRRADDSRADDSGSGGRQALRWARQADVLAKSARKPATASSGVAHDVTSRIAERCGSTR